MDQQQCAVCPCNINYVYINYIFIIYKYNLYIVTGPKFADDRIIFYCLNTFRENFHVSVV